MIFIITAIALYIPSRIIYRHWKYQQELDRQFYAYIAHRNHSQFRKLGK